MAVSEEIRQSAIRRVTELFHRAVISHATLTSALDLPIVLPDFKKSLFENHMAGTTAMRNIFSQIQAGVLLQDKTFSLIADGLAGQAAVNAETVISAAVIVLAHSTADDIFTGVCGIAMDLDPNGWKSELNSEKKIKLGDLEQVGAEGIFARELQQFKSRLSAKALPSRAALLFQHIPIKKNKDIGKEDDLYYRESKLQDADKLRHDIIHGSGLPVIPINKSRAVTTFLNEASLTAVRSVTFHFSLAWDAEYFVKLNSQGRK